MSLKYLTGEEIRKDDHVLFHREPGRIELVRFSWVIRGQIGM
jgi:hypothetical protein